MFWECFEKRNLWKCLKHRHKLWCSSSWSGKEIAKRHDDFCVVVHVINFVVCVPVPTIMQHGPLAEDVRCQWSAMRTRWTSLALQVKWGLLIKRSVHFTYYIDLPCTSLIHYIWIVISCNTIIAVQSFSSSDKFRDTLWDRCRFLSVLPVHTQHIPDLANGWQASCKIVRVAHNLWSLLTARRCIPLCHRCIHHCACSLQQLWSFA